MRGHRLKCDRKLAASTSHIRRSIAQIRKQIDHTEGKANPLAEIEVGVASERAVLVSKL